MFEMLTSDIVRMNKLIDELEAGEEEFDREEYNNTIMEILKISDGIVNCGEEGFIMMKTQIAREMIEIEGILREN